MCAPLLVLMVVLLLLLLLLVNVIKYEIFSFNIIFLLFGMLSDARTLIDLEQCRCETVAI